VIAPDAPSRLLPVPAPPHDPYSVMLAGQIGPTPSIGWRVVRLTRAEVDRGTRALVLAPAPAASRWLSEPNGSFGGLRPPSNVAVTSAGRVLLLDPATGEIRLFDPCSCRFVTVPCVARLADAPVDCAVPVGGSRISAPRDRMLDPRGIASCGGDLFIADRGHHRILRYAIGTWLPRGILRLPLDQRIAMGGTQWEPTGLAVDGAGRLIVSDPVNGRIDRFSARGGWLDTVALETGGANVAVDCRHTVYVVVEHDFIVAVPAGPVAVTTFEIDGGSDGYQWHSLRLSPLAADVRLDVDVQAGNEPWTVAHRDDPNNREWSRWLSADAIRRALTPLTLGGREGRYLRVRLTPAPGHVPAAFDATAHGARTRRIVGTTTEIVADARADLVEEFGGPPLIVDRDGRLHLLCDDGVRTFDGRGEAVTPDATRGDRFEREGRFLCGAIDSRIDACQWHRVELRGAIPPGCSVEVRTTTAEIELTTAELDDLPETSWTAIEPARSMAPIEKWSAMACSWDALIPARPGRFLWMELVLRGDGRQTPCVSSAIVEYPRISFRRYLPGVFGMDPAGADFTDRFTAIFDRSLRSIESRLDRLPMDFDPMSAPAEAVPGHPDFLSWLGQWIGISLAREWPEARRRRYVKEAARLYCRRGTPDGLHQQLLLLLGFDTAYGEHCLAERPQCRCEPRRSSCPEPPSCEPAEPPPLLLEHFKLRRWLYAGHGHLGDDSMLWGRAIVGRSELSDGTSPPAGNAQIGVTTLDTVPDPLRDPFHVYAHKFSVFVPARVRDDALERRALERLLRLEAPAHTEVDIRYVEPRYRVGVQASIGLDGVIARTPRGVTLDSSRLRQGTVLSGQPDAPHLRLDDTRVGLTTRLT
jgi:phage tail-like protein